METKPIYIHFVSREVITVNVEKDGFEKMLKYCLTAIPTGDCCTIDRAIINFKYVTHISYK